MALYCWWRTLLVVTLTFLSADGVIDPKDPDQKITDEAIECGRLCIDNIYCIAKRPDEFRNIIVDKCPEGSMEKALKMYKDIFHCENPSDTPEFWAQLIADTCPLSDDIKKDRFEKWFTEVGEEWAKGCNDPDCELCLQMTMCQEAVTELLAKYTENGICKTEAEILAEKSEKQKDETFKEGKETFNEGKEKMGGFGG